jgi:hypothetical protein
MLTSDVTPSSSVTGSNSDAPLLALAVLGLAGAGGLGFVSLRQRLRG